MNCLININSSLFLKLNVIPNLSPRLSLNLTLIGYKALHFSFIIKY
jgi:hypothetical protein